ncbi:hypothetical protein ACFPRL_27410 [Pseudoclavibacter helvolus]
MLPHGHDRNHRRVGPPSLADPAATLTHVSRVRLLARIAPATMVGVAGRRVRVLMVRRADVTAHDRNSGDHPGRGSGGRWPGGTC